MPGERGRNKAHAAVRRGGRAGGGGKQAGAGTLGCQGEGDATRRSRLPVGEAGRGRGRPGGGASGEEKSRTKARPDWGVARWRGTAERAGGGRAAAAAAERQRGFLN